MICRKCKTDHAHRSHREGRKDYALSLFQYYPYRCQKCMIRFFERRIEPREEAPTATETEIRATRGAYRRTQKRREFLLYGSALLCFVVFLYFVTRPAAQPLEAG
jgi:hypothetical protein